MRPSKKTSAPPRIQAIAEQTVSRVKHFLHIEATSGIFLLASALAALIFANSSYGPQYEHLWHIMLGGNLGEINLSFDLHFWVNDICMTLFFLVVGMEIKEEVCNGTLADRKQALLPIIAAIGGVILPAAIFIFFNKNYESIEGWAVPTATDIAFAVGILALLGKSVPHNVRIILLSLAIIDDIIAVIIIAVFYSQGLDPSGLFLIGLSLLLVLLFQKLGADNAWAYVPLGIILWFGLYKLGVHPSLAGVILGLLTPATERKTFNPPIKTIEKSITKLSQVYEQERHNVAMQIAIVNELRQSQRYLIAPAQRVQKALHPFVAFIIMPLFAFANAGVNFSQLELDHVAVLPVMLGVSLGLFLGKPLGILLASFLAVKLKICKLPKHVTWRNMLLIGLLAGIGFTMAIFVTLLAFKDANLINASKISVLIASALSALAGYFWGVILYKTKSKEK